MVLTVRPPASGAGGAGEPATGTRLAVRRVALPLMASRGYEAVTVDVIAAAAGISRRAFFRLFSTKHHVLSCDHEVFLDEVRQHLAAHPAEATLARPAQAMTLVLESLTAVRADAELRDRLLGSHPALNLIENQWYSRYEDEIAAHLTPDSEARPTVTTAMLAGAIVAAVKATLRDWLADPGSQPLQAFSSAVRQLEQTTAGASVRRTVAVIETTLTLDELLTRLDDDNDGAT